MHYYLYKIAHAMIGRYNKWLNIVLTTLLNLRLLWFTSSVNGLCAIHLHQKLSSKKYWSLSYSKYCMYLTYSQFTTTLTVWFTSFPMPFLALQRYVPSLVLLLGSRNCSPVNSTSLSLPIENTFVQVMFGTGSPSAVQVTLIAGSPSSTTWSGALVINEGGSAKESMVKSIYNEHVVQSL